VIHSTGMKDDFAAVVYGSRSGEIPDEAYDLLDRYADAADQIANRKLARMGVLTVRVSVGQCKTQNKMWMNDPEQKLWYTGATKWARRHAPELMLGIMSDDDLDYMKQQDRLGNNAQQARIESIIPATLDSLPPPSIPQQSTEEKEPPFSPPTAEEQSEAKEILQREETQTDSRDTEDNAIALENWCREVKQADSVLDVQGLENQAENVPAAVRSRFVEACLERKTEIRKQRGGRA